MASCLMFTVRVRAPLRVKLNRPFVRSFVRSIVSLTVVSVRGVHTMREQTAMLHKEEIKKIRDQQINT